MIDFLFGNWNKLLRTLSLMIPLVFFLPTVFMPYAAINLKTVHIEQSSVNGEIMVTAQRDIKPSWVSYTTTLRDAATNRSICDTPIQQRPRKYMPTSSDFIIVTLEWWMGSKADMDACKRFGFKPNHDYILKTCHYWHGPLNVVLARRCVDSNVFRVESIK